MLLYFLATFALLIFAISISWTVFRGAPWIPAGVKTVLKMLTLANTGPGDLVYDLGCGDGRVILAAVTRFGARAVGIEIDPLRYLWVKLLTHLIRINDRTEIIFGDFFKHDLSQADVVNCYLLQSTNEKLESKLLRELKPGTRVVSYSFTFPNMLLLAQDREAQIYCYQIEG
jgi:SAM-dependent methyltransferase